MEFSQSEQQKEKQILKIENSLTDLWDSSKCTNIHIIGVPEGEEKEKGIKNVFDEIMVKNFPNLKKKTDIQVQEAQRVPEKIIPNIPTPRHSTIKMVKVKERILKTARETSFQRLDTRRDPERPDREPRELSYGDTSL